MSSRQEELNEILEQAGPKAKAIASTITERAVELHIHIHGPIVIGAEITETIAALLLKQTK